MQTFTSNTLYVNLHLTGLITRLAWYPLPLIHSILLRPDIVVTSDTPSFHQVLRILKQQIDAELPVVEDSLEIIDVARSYLIDREFRLINARKASENSPLHVAKVITSQHSTYAPLSAASPVQVTPSSSYDPFKRSDTKRMSISKSITSMFSRKPNGKLHVSFTFYYYSFSFIKYMKIQLYYIFLFLLWEKVKVWFKQEFCFILTYSLQQLITHNFIILFNTNKHSKKNIILKYNKK